MSAKLKKHQRKRQKKLNFKNFWSFIFLDVLIIERKYLTEKKENLIFQSN